ncbi:hypothetical protein O1Q96_10145 [Streptomyces sp. Qhu-G9]|uniref:hypothetical protein n=1 Tax=Streptomyces sp. Qhu-G9 TaxID=3452799 RepID=UPI0022AC2666|nr:hypothetical protein [Streptomyces aurantiacus]WAU80074.1 hypothetical protein O1Q96_10145 [Streptomyces aurantiacus]
MGTLIISAVLALVVLGFDNPVWWLAAGALLYLHTRYVRTGRRSPGSSSPGGATRPSGGSGPSARGGDNSYRAYRQRRDQMARWERRYRRERPWMTRQK